MKMILGNIAIADDLKKIIKAPHSPPPPSYMLDYRHFQGRGHNGGFYMLRPPEMEGWMVGGGLEG